MVENVQLAISKKSQRGKIKAVRIDHHLPIDHRLIPSCHVYMRILDCQMIKYCVSYTAKSGNFRYDHGESYAWVPLFTCNVLVLNLSSKALISKCFFAFPFPLFFSSPIPNERISQKSESLMWVSYGVTAVKPRKKKDQNAEWHLTFQWKRKAKKKNASKIWN